MKITKISLQNFRAFDEPFELDLDGGKNLLLHGENGSGKSSIYTALKRFFEESGDDISDHRNHFAPAARASNVRLKLKGKDSSGVEREWEFHWDIADGHPLTVPSDPRKSPIPRNLRSILVDGSRRSGFVDYRMMLRTHLLSGPMSRSNKGPTLHDAIYGANTTGLESQLFDLVSMVILAGVRVTIHGGSVVPIGWLVRQIWKNRPVSRHSYVLRDARHHTDQFNDAFNSKLPELQTKLAEFLSEFDNHSLSIKFRRLSLNWDKDTLQLHGAELVPEITYRGTIVTDHHECLNEARLSALATCLFFAGVFLSDNDYANPAHPRFLVLDDALMGLEVENRLPILRILTGDAFKNYQIILMTHDRLWFDLASEHLRNEKGWIYRELLANEEAGQLIPRLQASKNDLNVANTHLKNGDFKAAAVYARSAFEWKLRKVAEEFGVKISYKSKVEQITADALWKGIQNLQRQREDEQKTNRSVPMFFNSTLETAVETMRSKVLNKLSHSGSPGLTRAEVQFAIDTVQTFQDLPFPKKG